MKFKTYPYYKDSKIRWVDKVPINWEIKQN